MQNISVSLNDTVIRNVALDPINPDKPFLIFPNPCNGSFVLMTNTVNVETATINIYDLMGRCIYLSEKKLLIGKNQILINIDCLPAGLYFVKIKTTSDLFTDKIIKK